MPAWAQWILIAAGLGVGASLLLSWWHDRRG
jgi:hypothetical protein